MSTDFVYSSSSSSTSAPVLQKENDCGRLLIAANVPEMFRDFLNPFGKHFRNHGWTVDAAARGLRQSSECDNNFDHLWDVNWSRNPWGTENLRAPKVFRRLVEAAGYDLIHVHTPVPAFISRCAMARIAEKKRPRIVYTVHGFHFHDRGSYWKNHAFLSLEKIAGRWTDCLIVINRADEEAARQHRLAPDRKIVYMPGIGIERKDYEPRTVSETAVAAFRKDLQIDAETPLLVMLAEFSPGKRHRDALRAVARMKRRDAHLILAGEGPILSEMTILADQLDISERVHFVGFRRDVPVLLRSASLSLLPSEREGLPKSVMEALNMGLPVVGSDVRGIRDLLADGAGMLVPLGDTDRLAEAMDWVLDHPDESKRMGETGRLRMGLYERHRILGLHEELYGKLLNRLPFAVAQTETMAKEIKRFLDIVFSLGLLLMASPLFLLSCAAIWIRMGRPILFQQQRAGLLGQVFTLYKLRTMSCATDEFGNLLPVRHRLTPIGRTLRHFSIDELPQLWNVLRGDMSLIGPRPLLATYLPRYNERQRQRHLVRPGITGYAQVTGRNALTWETKFDLDVYYVSHWSLWLDLRIAVKTVWAVVSAANTEEIGHPSETEFLGIAHECIASEAKGQQP